MGFRTYSQNKDFFNKFIFPYTWSIAKTWLNILVDDLEEQHKFEIFKKNHSFILFKKIKFKVYL